MYKKLVVLIEHRLKIPKGVQLSYHDQGVYTSTGELINVFPAFDLYENIKCAHQIKISDVYFQSFFESKYCFVMIPLCSENIQKHISNSIGVYLERNKQILVAPELEDKSSLVDFQAVLESCYRLQSYYRAEIHPVTNFLYENFKNWNGKMLQNVVNKIVIIVILLLLLNC